MSAPKFTPGPWSLGNENDACCDVSTGKTVVGLDRADPHVGGYVISRDEMVANANLIAAAPELYAALEAMVKTTVVHGSGSKEEAGSRAFRLAATALAKARGES